VQAAVVAAEFRGRNRKTPLSVRFWAKVYRTTGCWIWLGGLWKSHGAFNRTQAHRVAWELTYGKIPLGMHVLHKCDVGPCVNPDHLFLGTHLDNMRDAYAKGRMHHAGWFANLARGSRQHSAKLSKDAVRAIVTSTGTHKEIARRFDVGVSAVKRIRNGTTWKHVFPGEDVRRDRTIRGSASPIAKLDDDAVQAIRSAPDSYRIIAKRFGVHVSVVSRVKGRSAWKHVP